MLRKRMKYKVDAEENGNIIQKMLNIQVNLASLMRNYSQFKSFQNIKIGIKSSKITKNSKNTNN